MLLFCKKCVIMMIGMTLMNFNVIKICCKGTFLKIWLCKVEISRKRQETDMAKEWSAIFDCLLFFCIIAYSSIRGSLNAFQ